MNKKLIVEIIKLGKINLDCIGNNEENIKIKIIIPILELLGYNKIQDLDFEKNIRNKRADIAIIVNSKVKLIVETKKFSEKLDDHIDQALSYAWNFQVNWVFLTNGLEIRLYKSFIEGVVDYRDRLIFKTKIDALEENFDSLYKLISKSNIINEENLNSVVKSIKENVTEKLLINDLYECRKRLYNDLFDNIKDRYKYDDDFKKTLIKWAFETNINTEDPSFLEKLCLEGVYTLINRVLFLRILEDRKFVKPKLDSESLDYLKRMVEKTSSIMNLAFKEIGEKFGGLYYAPLFDSIYLEDIEWNDESILFLLERLSSHNFAEINRDIIGKTYEKHISKQERKDLGQFYTPDYIIEVILNFTIKELFKVKPPNEIKILDPACGSGGFLIKAYDILRKEYLEKGFYSNTIHQHILENNLYGIDINPFATQLTAMNLLLKDLENPTAKINIVVGDSLDRRLDNSLEIDLHDTPLSKINNYNKSWASLKSIIDNKPFDVIIGNPPYIRVQNLEEQKKKVYKKLYQSAVGSYDICILFLERALELLSNGGILGFIISSKFMNSNYGKNIRKYIKDNAVIENIIDLRELKIFDEATTYPIILIIRKQENQNSYFNYKKIIDSDIFYIKEKILDGSKFEKLESDFLNEKGWVFQKGKNAQILHKLENIESKLEDYTDNIFQGVKTGADNIFILNGELNLNKSASFLTTTDGKEKIEIESNILKKLLRGKDISKYKIEKSNSCVIFPYKKEKDTFILYDEKEFYSYFKKAFDYLRKNKEVLKNRDRGKIPESRWFGYSRPQNLLLFDKKKIITPFNSFENSFFLDDQESFFTAGVSGGCGIILKKEYEKFYNYFLAILNSKISEYYIKNTSDSLKGKYYSYEKRFIKTIPIIFDSKDERVMEVIKLVDGINEDYINIGQINEKIDNILFDIYNINI
ncbi:MAG: Eco57I restriction-modification methylase domain-containing protein [Candidatus Humimicrobiaceae bacterium]